MCFISSVLALHTPFHMGVMLSTANIFLPPEMGESMVNRSILTGNRWLTQEVLSAVKHLMSTRWKVGVVCVYIYHTWPGWQSKHCHVATRPAVVTGETAGPIRLEQSIVY